MRNVLTAETHVIFSCEGTFEEVAVRILNNAGKLIVAPENVVAISRKRKASEIQEEFLNFEYSWPVAVVRIADSRSARFKLGKLYADRYPVINVLTRPEAEMLVIIHEGKYEQFAKAKSTVKPSVFCKDVLGIRDVKTRKFLEAYWDKDSLVDAARKYKRLSRLDKGEMCLADIIKQ